MIITANIIAVIIENGASNYNYFIAQLHSRKYYYKYFFLSAKLLGRPCIFVLSTVSFNSPYYTLRYSVIEDADTSLNVM